MLEIRLDPHSLRQWLMSKPPDTVVGRGKFCHACPIARYLHETTGLEVQVVAFQGGLAIKLPSGESIPLPWGWATKFVSRVDALHSDGSVVTASEALSLLDEVL